MFGKGKKALSDQLLDELKKEKAKGNPTEGETDDEAEEGGEPEAEYDRKAKVTAVREFREALDEGDDEAAADAFEALMESCK